MASSKRKAVVNADTDHLRRVDALIAAGRYRTLSDFVREAMGDKLDRLQHELLVDEVTRYCAAGYAHEDADLIAAQALDAPRAAKRAPRGRRRAKG